MGLRELLQKTSHLNQFISFHHRALSRTIIRKGKFVILVSKRLIMALLRRPIRHLTGSTWFSLAGWGQAAYSKHFRNQQPDIEMIHGYALDLCWGVLIFHTFIYEYKKMIKTTSIYSCCLSDFWNVSVDSHE